jgi:delta-1-pyrroline-5-carboxylate synthetase
VTVCKCFDTLGSVDDTFARQFSEQLDRRRASATCSETISPETIIERTLQSRESKCPIISELEKNLAKENMSSANEHASRAALRTARRVCVKVGTSVVANENGRPSLTRLGAIAEQISELKEGGVEVIFVSSGAVDMGTRVLNNQRRLHMSFKDMHEEGAKFDEASAFEEPSTLLSHKESPLTGNSSFVSKIESYDGHTSAEKKEFYDSACAAAGQFEMMNLYSALFNQCDVTASQVLVTQADFADPSGLENLKYTVERLLTLGILPIINENDAVSGSMGYTGDDVFSANDSLASICARNFDAEVLLLLTDVEGVFDQPPSNPGAKLIDIYVDKAAAVEVSETQGTFEF